MPVVAIPSYLGCIYAIDRDTVLYITNETVLENMFEVKEYMIEFSKKSAIPYRDVQDVLISPDSFIYANVPELLASIQECGFFKSTAKKNELVAATFQITKADQLGPIREYVEDVRPTLDFLLDCFHKIGHAAAFIEKNVTAVLIPQMFYLPNILCTPDGPIIIPLPSSTDVPDNIKNYAARAPLLIGTSTGLKRIIKKKSGTKSLYKQGAVFDMPFLKKLLMNVSSRKHVQEAHPDIWNEIGENHHSCLWKMPFLILLISYYHKTSAGDVCHLINAVLNPATTYRDLNPEQFSSYASRHRTMLVHPSEVFSPKERGIKLHDAGEFKLFPFKTKYTIEELKKYKERPFDAIVLGIEKFIQDRGDRSIQYTNFIEIPRNDDLTLLIENLKELQRYLTPEIRLLVIPLYFWPWVDKELPHANILIIDTHRLESEHFEPHGNAFYKEFGHTIDPQQKLSAALKKAFPWIKHHYTPMDFEPSVGLQFCELVLYRYPFEDGYCETWSLVYGIHRILYPDIPRENLMKLLLEHTSTIVYENQPSGILASISRQSRSTRMFLGNTNAFEYARHAAAWLVNAINERNRWDWNITMHKLSLADSPRDRVFVRGSLSKSRSRSRSRSRSQSK
jgi:hypothetical protein